MDVCPNNKNSPHFKQQASNKPSAKADYNNQSYQKSRSIHVSKTDGRNQKRQYESGAKRKWNDNQDAKEEPDPMLSGWNKNRNGNCASPAVRHALKNVEKLPAADKKHIVPAGCREHCCKLCVKRQQSGYDSRVMQTC